MIEIYQDPISSILDPKTILGLLGLVFVIGVLLMVIGQLQNSPLGDNVDANKTLENTKQALNILAFGAFIIDGIKGNLALILIIAGIVAIFFKWRSRNIRP